MPRTRTREQDRQRPVFAPNIAHGEIVSGAELVSRSLKDVSRQMRRPPSILAGTVAQQAERLKTSFGAWVMLAFIAVVALPVSVAGLYLAIFASDQYASEARFAVRGGETGALNPMAMLTGTSQNQDSLIVTNYIRDRGMVQELEKTLDLRQMFSKEADWLFGFNPQKSAEKLTRYWRWQVDASIESMSGIITVVVRAFTPEDALAISRGIIAASEKLVNDLSERARKDALRQAQGELTLAENALQDKIKAMRALRDREGLLDAGKTSDAMTKLMGSLRLEVAKMESEYSANRRTVEESSPQMRVLAARIRSTKEQIRLIEGRMTDQQKVAAGAVTGGVAAGGLASAGGAGDPALAAAAAPAGDPALAESMGRFDRLKLEQGFAQKHYVEAAAALERARANLDTQQIYLATFLQPVLAQEALYPKAGWILAALTAICLVLWGGGVGIAVLVRNYGA